MEFPFGRKERTYKPGSIALSEPRIVERLTFLGLTPEDVGVVASWADECRKALPKVSERFYEAVTKSASTNGLLHKHTTVPKMRPNMERYLSSLFDGRIDDAWVSVRNHVGKRHDEIDLDCMFYFGGYEVLRDSFGRAVEAAGDVSTLLLDKTGTITFGNRRASDVLPVEGATREELLRAAYLSSLADETPEGRSIVDYALAEGLTGEVGSAADLLRDGAQFVPFTAQTRMSGVDVATGTRVRKGAGSALARWVHDEGGHMAHDVDDRVDEISTAGGTPLVVAIQEPGTAPRQLGVIFLKDIVKPGMAERFAQLRQMGIRTVMITGDNPLTAAAIAKEAGVDDFLAEATPEDKMALIKAEQEGGRLVAMTGDGTNDAPALAQADVGVAMNTGTSAAKEAGNMVDLDSDPTKLIDIVGIGKQLLITRGALTTFSIANDIAKYFAIIPAMFVSTFPGLAALNVMRLHSPQSAMLSAVIFNALVIVALIPLSLKGVAYRPLSAAALLRRNLIIYGLGGVLTPFLGIKAIDLLVSLVPGLS